MLVPNVAFRNAIDGYHKSERERRAAEAQAIRGFDDGALSQLLARAGILLVRAHSRLLVDLRAEANALTYKLVNACAQACWFRNDDLVLGADVLRASAAVNLRLAGTGVLGSMLSETWVSNARPGLPRAWRHASDKELATHKVLHSQGYALPRYYTPPADAGSLATESAYALPSAAFQFARAPAVPAATAAPALQARVDFAAYDRAMALVRRERRSELPMITAGFRALVDDVGRAHGLLPLGPAALRPLYAAVEHVLLALLRDACTIASCAYGLADDVDRLQVVVDPAVLKVAIALANRTC
jgi:hypothetical protein